MFTGIVEELAQIKSIEPKSKGIRYAISAEVVVDDLKIGDMLIYAGCDLEHWREPFQGMVCSQVFLHYNHANGPFAKTNIFDKRKMLGLPPSE